MFKNIRTEASAQTSLRILEVRSLRANILTSLRTLQPGPLGADVLKDPRVQIPGGSHLFVAEETPDFDSVAVNIKGC